MLNEQNNLQPQQPQQPVAPQMAGPNPFGIDMQQPVQATPVQPTPVTPEPIATIQTQPQTEPQIQAQPTGTMEQPAYNPPPTSVPYSLPPKEETAAPTAEQTTTQPETIQDPEPENKKDKKKKEGGGFPIISIFLLIAIAYGSYAFLKPKIEQLEANKGFQLDTGSEWGDKYGTYLMNNLKEEQENVKITFIDLDLKKGDVPELVISYDKEETPYIQIGYLSEEKNVEVTEEFKESTLDVVYAVATGEPEWYIVGKDNKAKTYIAVKDIIEKKTYDTLYSNKDNFNDKYITTGQNIKYQNVKEGYIESGYSKYVHLYNQELYINKDLQATVDKKIKKKLAPTLVCSKLDKQWMQTYTINFDSNKAFKSAKLKTYYSTNGTISIEDARDIVELNAKTTNIYGLPYEIEDNGRDTVTYTLEYNKEQVLSILNLDPNTPLENIMVYIKDTLTQAKYNCVEQ